MTIKTRLLNAATIATNGVVVLLSTLGLYYFFSMLSGGVIWYLITVIIFCVAVLRVADKSTRLPFYLLLVICVPFFGMALCTCFALENALYKTRLSTKSQNDYCDDMAMSILPPNFAKVAKYVDKTTFFKYHSAQNLQYFCNSTDFFISLLQDVSTATDFLYFQFYIVQDSQVLPKLLSAIYGALERGVKVEVVVDYFGSHSFLCSGVAKNLQSAGCKITAFGKPRLFTFAKINHRSHKKIIVVDGKVGYVGGVNMASDKMLLAKDSALRIEGSAVINLQNMFLNVNATGDNVVLTHGKNGYILPFSTRGYGVLQSVLLSLIYSAKKSVIISTPYLSFGQELHTALQSAVLEGVSVSVLVAEKVGKLTYAQNFHYAQVLHRLGVNVFFYQPQFLHQKLLVCDDNLALLGSANFDMRSQLVQEESCALIADNRVIGEVITDFNISLAKSKPFDMADKPSAFLRTAGVLLQPISFLF